MGTVHLTNGHHGLKIRTPETDPAQRILLTREILKRSFVSYDGQLVGPHPYYNVVRGALQALMDLPGFDAAVSHHTILVKNQQHIYLPDREWGEITLGTPDNVVLGFSHDSRESNSPFDSLSEWLEEKGPGNKPSKAQLDRFYTEWSSPEKWLAFFKERLQRTVDELESEVAKLKRKADGKLAEIAALKAGLASK